MSSTFSFISDLQNEFPELNAVEKTIRQFASSSTRQIKELINIVLTGSGKRVRPLLVILAASFYSVEKDAVTEVASAAELIHLASLVHDDVVDGSEKRRGHPTVNKHCGGNVAVLLGDILFAHALELLDKHSNFGVTTVMSKAISTMCEGELEQISSLFDLEKTEEEYLEQVRKKTGALMGACCEAGGRLSEMPENEVWRLREFGERIGSAFQIVDDIFDFNSDPKKLGKPVGLDIRQGIVTLPLISVLNHKKANSPLIKRIFNRTFLESSEVDYIRDLVMQEGGTDLAFSRAEAIVKDANQYLDPLPDGRSKKSLLELSGYVLRRQC